MIRFWCPLKVYQKTLRTPIVFIYCYVALTMIIVGKFVHLQRLIKKTTMMRRVFVLLTVLAVAVDAWAWKPLFVGHRGCNIGVENTAEAYRNGVDVYGYDGLECDVRVTKDGFYVISHDETTNRLGGNLTVANATLAELRAEEYTQTRNGVTYTGHICTVDEYLAICVEKGVFPVIELKWTTGINNNDMSNFEGLAHLVIDQGLADKVIFLTSMKQSQEYIATYFPQFTRQPPGMTSFMTLTACWSPSTSISALTGSKPCISTIPCFPWAAARTATRPSERDISVWTPSSLW